MWQKFLKLWFFLFLGILLSGVLLCVIVNPFNIHNIFDESRISSQDEHFHTYHRLAAAYQLITKEPSILLIGNSHVRVGMDQNHPAFQQYSGRVYKAGFPGASLYELYEYIKHSSFNNDLRLIVVGLDFGMFLSWRLLPPDYDSNRMYLNNKRQYWKYYSAYLIRETVLSEAALSASFLKLMGRKFDQQEFWLKKGYYSHFKFREHNLWNHLKLISSMPDKSNSQGRRYHFIRSLSEKNHDINISALEKLVAFCASEKIKLVLFINPSHARLYEILRVTNNWEKFELLKQSIVQSIEENSAPESPVELWDFSGYNSITTDPVPAPDDQVTHMFGYWETVHYKPAVGNIILDKIFLRSSNFKDAYEDFGYRIDSHNIDEHLARIRRDQSYYRESHPADVNDIESLQNVLN